MADYDDTEAAAWGNKEAEPGNGGSNRAMAFPLNGEKDGQVDAGNAGRSLLARRFDRYFAAIFSVSLGLGWPLPVVIKLNKLCCTYWVHAFSQSS